MMPTPSRRFHPRKEFKDRIELYQFRRGAANPTWDARFKVNGDWTGWTSLATEDWDDAVFVAVDKLKERELAHQHGIVIPGRKRKETNTVAEVAAITVPRLRAEQVKLLATKESKKAHVFTAKLSSITNRLLPAFGDRGIANLTEDDMESFRLAVTLRSNGAVPKRSTIANINSAWLEVLRDAVDQGFITRARRKFLIISQEGFAKGIRGASFSRQEMTTIMRLMSDAWVSQGHTLIRRENRYLLRALISLMSTTGITPGLEVETLTPAQVVETKDTNGESSVRVQIRNHQGKRAGSRTVWARVNDVCPVVEDMARLKGWIAANATETYRQQNPKGYIFCRPSDGEFPIYHRVFEEILEELGLRVDQITGVNRRLYSCRHYYATQALQDGVSVTYVANNMGTSERMIQDHYSHVITDQRSGDLTGSRLKYAEMVRPVERPVPAFHQPDDGDYYDESYWTQPPPDDD